MPPQKRATAKAADAVKVEPASAAQPRTTHTASTPSKKEVAAAVEKSAAFLEQQAAPPTDAHPKPTTPTQADVSAAVDQSAEFLMTRQNVPDSAPTETRDRVADAAPVSAGGPSASLAAAPVDAGRDKTMDASPTFSAPVRTTPTEE